MTKHTPGPWLEDHTAEPEVMAQALLDNPSWVAVEDTSENGGHVAYCAPENAPLIADAPAMLKALKLCAKALDAAFDSEGNPFGREHNNATDALLTARALIVKHREPNQ